MSGNVIETVMGAVVLVAAALFLFFAYTTSQVRAVQSYELTAQFERVVDFPEGPRAPQFSHHLLKVR